MQAALVQIGISQGGLPKRPVPTSLLTPLGLEGDRCAHPGIHGGPDKAVLLVTAGAIEELKARGFPLFYGALGENLTVEGLDYRELRSGRRFRVGQAAIELTTMRSPCRSLDIYGRALREELTGGLGGFYARVLQPGPISAGDPVLPDATWRPHFPK